MLRNITDTAGPHHRAKRAFCYVQEFKHIGPVTARIFLREVAPIWYGQQTPH
jgi:hypothetical protein